MLIRTMETLGAIKMIEIGAQLGLTGLVLVLWFLTDRSKNKMMEIYRADMAKILDQYGADMEEVRHMYESNVRLVQAYDNVARDLREVVIINTQTMQRLSEEVRTNQYCPAVRVIEKKKGKRE